MHAQVPAVEVFPRRGGGRPNDNEHGPLAHMLMLVAVSLAALVLTHLDRLIVLGFWGSVRTVAVTGGIELLMLLLAAAIVRGFRSAQLL